MHCHLEHPVGAQADLQLQQPLTDTKTGRIIVSTRIHCNKLYARSRIPKRLNEINNATKIAAWVSLDPVNHARQIPALLHNLLCGESEINETM